MNNVIGILFGISLVVVLSKGLKVSLKSGAYTRCVNPGDTTEIEWEFDASISDLVLRTWVLGSDTLATIHKDEDADIESVISLPKFDIKKPGTLILEKVDSGYNGTYSFQVQRKNPTETVTSYVTVLIPIKPTVTFSCSGSTQVTEGDDVECLCEGTGGNPPAQVMLYKDGKRIDSVGKEQNLLNLTSVNPADNGTYKCVAQSCDLKDEKSVSVFVNFISNKPSISFDPNPAILGKQLTVTCEVAAQPEADYKIFHNGTTVSTKNTYSVSMVNYTTAGIYKCFAENVVGNSSTSVSLTVSAASPTEATTVKTTEPVGSSDKSSDGLGGGAIAGIVIGVLAVIVIIVVVVWLLKFKKKGGESRARNDNNYDAVERNRSTNGDNEMPEYAVVNKKKDGPTYATLDKEALGTTERRKKGDEPTQYADIQFDA